MISRESGSFRFPADFMLVAAMNPCKCGYYPDMSRCHCTENEVKRYFGKLSQPLLDRIDICVEAPRLSFDELSGRNREETSEEIRRRVIQAMDIQKRRYRDRDFFTNSRIPANEIMTYCLLDRKEEDYMERLYSKLHLSARTYHRLLRVARTIADLDGEENIRLRHLEEVVCYRGIERWDWENSI